MKMGIMRERHTRCRNALQSIEDNALGMRVDIERGRAEKTNQRLIAFTRELHCQGGGG